MEGIVEVGIVHRGYRRWDDRRRGDLDGRHRLLTIGARGRQRNGRSGYAIHQAQIQPAHRRTDRRRDQD